MEASSVLYTVLMMPPSLSHYCLKEEMSKFANTDLLGYRDNGVIVTHVWEKREGESSMNC